MDRKKHYISYNCFYEKLLNLKSKKRIKVNNFPILWNDSSIIRENDNDYNVLISKDILDKGLYIRYWRDGDECYLKYYDKYVKVKKLFINNKLSIFDKLVTPIFIDSSNQILSIPNIYNKNKNSCIKINWGK